MCVSLCIVYALPTTTTSLFLNLSHLSRRIYISFNHTVIQLIFRWNPFVCYLFGLYGLRVIYLFVLFIHCQNVKIKFKIYACWLAGWLTRSVHLYFILCPCPFEAIIIIIMYIASEQACTYLLNEYIVPKKFKTWWPNRPIFFIYLSVVVVFFCYDRVCTSVLLNLAKWNDQNGWNFSEYTVSSLRMLHINKANSSVNCQKDESKLSKWAVNSRLTPRFM